MRKCRWADCEAPDQNELTQIYEYTYDGGSRRVFAHSDAVHFYHRIEFLRQVRWRVAAINAYDEVPTNYPE